MRFLDQILDQRQFTLVDTLHWSPLLFPERPYHSLLKDDKLQQDDLKLCERYAESACLADCLELLDDFASTHPAKYRSDFDEFLLESKMEDFGRAEKGSVVVSTIQFLCNPTR